MITSEIWDQMKFMSQLTAYIAINLIGFCLFSNLTYYPACAYYVPISDIVFFRGQAIRISYEGDDHKILLLNGKPSFHLKAVLPEVEVNGDLIIEINEDSRRMLAMSLKLNSSEIPNQITASMEHIALKEKSACPNLKIKITEATANFLEGHIKIKNIELTLESNEENKSLIKKICFWASGRYTHYGRRGRSTAFAINERLAGIQEN